jgi:hypothetical protein
MVTSGTSVGSCPCAAAAGAGASATFASSRSPGRLRCTGPGRPLAAMVSARAMSSPMLAALSTRHAALVTGRAAPTWSISWKAPRPA